MEKDSTFTFIIDHIDPLGQGVYKEGEDIFFIPKTLPGETGRAIVKNKTKNLHFCEVESLDQESSRRIEPECKHFSQCSGCHFLHTDRENEIAFKLESFKRMLRVFDHPEIKTIKDKMRLHYRNRIQLHFDKKRKKLGFMKAKSKFIHSVPNCQIIDKKLVPELEETYLNWEKMTQSPLGHIEIYKNDEQIKVSINKSYADGGFSQVNEPANKLMLNKISKISQAINSENVVDLFAGNGNISQAINYKKRLCIDLYSSKMRKEFFSLNLFDETALDTFSKEFNNLTCDLLIVDPPRSGFKDLALWVKKVKPQHLLYISCHPQTMVRDLQSLGAFNLKEVYMIDLFPSTYHFEGMCLIELSKT